MDVSSACCCTSLFPQSLFAGLRSKPALWQLSHVSVDASKTPHRTLKCSIQGYKDSFEDDGGCDKPLCTIRRGASCCVCGRRHLLGAMGTLLLMETKSTAHASDKMIAEAIHHSRPEWYEELFATQMAVGMKSYEMELAGYKHQLFDKLDKDAKTILELGVGTCPNMKYYAKTNPDISIIGVDPNTHMERYARAAASAAGLSGSQFTFVPGIGEALPVKSGSVDAVVSTLVLCSVADVASTLKEVQRVLKPGGAFIFIEHVAAPEGSNVRFWQNVLDPIQELVADGCHLTRDTLKSIQQANFAMLNARTVDISHLLLINYHILGIAQA